MKKIRMCMECNHWKIKREERNKALKARCSKMPGFIYTNWNHRCNDGIDVRESIFTKVKKAITNK